MRTHKEKRLPTLLLIGLGLVVIGALAWWRMFPDRSLVRAWESAGAQQWTRVVTELEPYVRTHPQDIEAISLLARAYAELGEDLASAAQWERIPHDSPQKRSALVEQGVALLSAKYAARAEQAWLDCLAMAGPDDHDDIFE